MLRRLPALQPPALEAAASAKPDAVEEAALESRQAILRIVDPSALEAAA